MQEVLNGDQVYAGYGLGLNQYNDSKPCPKQNEYDLVKQTLIKILTETSLDELAAKLDGIATLK